ncbi:unnamed protein product, partial [Heterotrigona itama]
DYGNLELWLPCRSCNVTRQKIFSLFFTCTWPRITTEIPRQKRYDFQLEK